MTRRSRARAVKRLYAINAWLLDMVWLSGRGVSKADVVKVMRRNPLFARTLLRRLS